MPRLEKQAYSNRDDPAVPDFDDGRPLSFREAIKRPPLHPEHANLERYHNPAVHFRRFASRPRRLV